MKISITVSEIGFVKTVKYRLVTDLLSFIFNRKITLDLELKVNRLTAEMINVLKQKSHLKETFKNVGQLER